MMPRRVVPEALDTLAADDPRARRSRSDLLRLNALMGARGRLAGVLAPLLDPRALPRPLRLLELGAGDGRLMLAVAARLPAAGHGVHATLLDRHDLVAPATVRAFAGHGWTVRREVADVLEWAGRPPPPARWDAIVANLFLHHFETPAQRRLLAAAARRTRLLFVCEPRRGWTAAVGSRLVGVVGANAVTRQDAVLSVRAGFRGRDLAALWPGDETGWHLEEYAAGVFSHCLLARRREAPR